MTALPRILLTVADLAPASGGPSRTVPGLARALAQIGVPVEILALESIDGSRPDPGVEVTYVAAGASRLRDVRAAGPWREAVRRRCNDGAIDLIHDAGLWLPIHHATAAVAAQLQLPRVVSPRGMLEPWALGHRSLKKNLAWQLYQRRDLNRAALLHATSAQEAEGFRKAGMRNPIGIVPNGIDLPADESPRGDPASPRRALFLSRLHPKKGLLDLVAAWAAVKPENWKVTVAGPDEGGHLAAVRREVSAAGLNSQFEFVGVVDDSAKWRLYRDAEIFVLPTYSENFGLVIAEALGSGLPVITTRGTPWKEIETEKTGWWVPTGADALALALREATTLPPGVLREMGGRGRRLVEARYPWRPQAERMVAIYLWLLGRGDRPDCVEVV